MPKWSKARTKNALCSRVENYNKKRGKNEIPTPKERDKTSVKNKHEISFCDACSSKNVIGKCCICPLAAYKTADGSEIVLK